MEPAAPPTTTSDDPSSRWGSRSGSTEGKVRFTAIDRDEVGQGFLESNRTIATGVAWVLVGLVVTIGSLLLAPGGYVILAVPPIGAGAFLVAKGVQLRKAVWAEADRLERSGAT
ncbi:hypothetical protein [Aquihabitans sp. McL0605]|uniref:hypothetical protein n=1 Tax=Aquihabitans sp. McL0605 TaxID=3415671 RepID=UPI003CF3983A